MFEAPDGKAVELSRFNRLIRELMTGSCIRDRFDPWEIALLLDIAECKVSAAKLPRLLRKYQRWIQRNAQNAMVRPEKFSRYLAGLRAKRHRESRTDATLTAPEGECYACTADFPHPEQ